jgi:hypothetical protein
VLIFGVAWREVGGKEGNASTALRLFTIGARVHDAPPEVFALTACALLLDWAVLLLSFSTRLDLAATGFTLALGMLAVTPAQFEEFPRMPDGPGSDG